MASLCRCRNARELPHQFSPFQRQIGRAGEGRGLHSTWVGQLGISQHLNRLDKSGWHKMGSSLAQLFIRATWLILSPTDYLIPEFNILNLKQETESK